jgi:hypothetical protein
VRAQLPRRRINNLKFFLNANREPMAHDDPPSNARMCGNKSAPIIRSHIKKHTSRKES